MSEYDPLEAEQTQAAQADKAKRRAREEAEDFRWLVGNKRGRRIVWRMLERAGVFRTSFETNAMATAFNEGRRDFGLYLLTSVQGARAETFGLMQTENAEHEQRDTDAADRNDQ